MCRARKTGCGGEGMPHPPATPARARRVARPRARAHVPTPEPPLLDRGQLREAGLREAFDDRLTRGRLVVPRERDLTHEVRVRRLEPGESLEDVGEAHYAAFAADPADLDRVALGRHGLRVSPVLRS